MNCNYIYLTSFLDARWERRTGIPRVEYEIAREFVPRGAMLITYSKFRRRFVIVDFATVEQIVRLQDQSLDTVIDQENSPPAGPAARLASRAAVGLACGLGGAAGSKLLALASPSLTPQDRRRAAERLKLFEKTSLAIRYLDALSLPAQAPKRTPINEAIFKPGDTITIPGIIWDKEPLAELDRLRREIGVRLTAYVHDIIPVRRPEFHTDTVGVDRFRRYIETLIRCCDCFCVNSDFVAADLSAFIRETGHRNLPVIKVPLCANVTPETPPHLTPRLQSLALPADKYALYVSTLSPRKNHMAAYLLWRRLFEKLGDRLPPLVLAGQRGWNAGDTYQQMSRDATMWGKYIHYVEAPTDAELAHLYRHCGFTIFPSHYEGWGLPITESLEFGKPCIAADNTSLREAGQGLALNIDTLDGLAWLTTIVQFVEDATRLPELSERIAMNYQQRSWHQVGKEMFEIVTNQAQARSALATSSWVTLSN